MPEGTNDDKGGNTDDPKDLRTKLDAANKEKSDLLAKVTRMEQDNLLRDDAKLGHLSPRQRRSVLRELAEDGKDLTPESAREIAEELGYPAEAPKTATTSTTNGDQGNQGNQSQEGQPDPNVVVDDSLGAFSTMEQAQQSALRGNIDPTLETKINAAKTPEELTDLLRKEGSRSGIVHSWDVS